MTAAEHLWPEERDQPDGETAERGTRPGGDRAAAQAALDPGGAHHSEDAESRRADADEAEQRIIPAADLHLLRDIEDRLRAAGPTRGESAAKRRQGDRR